MIRDMYTAWRPRGELGFQSTSDLLISLCVCVCVCVCLFNSGVIFKGTTIGMAPLEGMCSLENSGGINVVRGDTVYRFLHNFPPQYLLPARVQLLVMVFMLLCDEYPQKYRVLLSTSSFCLSLGFYLGSKVK